MIMPAWNEQQSAAVQAMAGVLQSVLTIVALGLAIWVPWWQQRQATKLASVAQHNRACAMAQVLRIDVLNVRDSAREIYQLIRASEFRVPPSPNAYSEGALDRSFTFPPRLQAALEHLHIMPDDVVPHIAKLIVMAESYNSRPAMMTSDLAQQIITTAEILESKLDALIR